MSASREKRLRRELREAEENSDIVKKEKKKKKKKVNTPARTKRIRGIIGTVVAVVLVVAFALLIFVNSGVLQKNATAVTVGSHTLTPAEFNYYYQDTYNNIKSTYTSYGYWDYLVDTSEPIVSQTCYMGSDDDATWGDYIRETALDSALQVYALYDAAMEAGYTLDEETQESLDEVADSLESYATSYSYYDAEEYLEEYYGKGATVESYVNYLTVQQIASGYAQEKEDSFEYTDDELEEYYTENKLDFDKVTYRVFTVTTSDDDEDAAKETADAMLAELDSTEKSFSDAAYKYADEDYKESYEDADYTLRSSYSYSSVSSDYVEWLFSDERVEGESSEFETSTGYAVVMFVSRDDNHYNTVNVRHILVQVESTGDDDETTDEDWANCLAAIEEIQAQWEESDMTEDTFASMAEELSEDTGSNTNGGLYEDVYKGQMKTEFNDWCFDDSRQVGDWGVVQTDYGYHLMYFSGVGDEYWKSLADDAKRSDDYDAWYEDYSASYEAKTSFFGMLFTYKDLSAD
jgi:hypothetical protein